MYTNNPAASSVASAFFDFAECHGFALVKVHPGAKNPVGDGWQNLSSRNRADWESWQAEGFNVGVHAGASRVVIFDLDQKHGGIEAVRARFDAWCHARNMAPLPHHVTTPSGGQHVFMRVPEGVDAMALASDLRGTIGKGVDVLTGDRQSVAPGSFFNGAEGKPAGFYTFHDAPLYPAPQSVIDFCTRAPLEAVPVSKTGTHDRGDVAGLVDWLAERDDFEDYQDWVNLGMALKLEYGDDGKEIWARSHDETVTEDVIATKWKSFATSPEPGAVTLATFMKRAHSLGWTGSIRPAGMFAGVAQLVAMASPPLVPGAPGPAESTPMASDEAPPARLLKNLGGWLKGFKLPEYLWDGILIKRFCYSLTAQTGTGKTAIALLVAMHAAIGKALAGRDVERGMVVYLAGENPTDVQMRFLGMCEEMKIDPDTIDINIIEGSMDISKHADQIKAECEADSLKPSLVIVDTAAAYFGGDNDNDNVQMGNYARQLRELCKLPGEPCVMVLCHPTKNAKDISEMVPRGGGAFLNEMDGNLAAARDGGLIGVQAIGKFRGPEFTPLHFGLHTVRDCPALFDPKKGKFLPTVIAHVVSEAGVAAKTMEGETIDIRLMRDIEAHPADTQRNRAARLGCDGSTVNRRIKNLTDRKLIAESELASDRLTLTSKGGKELNALETVQQAATSVIPFPVPSRP